MKPVVDVSDVVMALRLVVTPVVFNVVHDAIEMRDTHEIRVDHVGDGVADGGVDRAEVLQFLLPDARVSFFATFTSTTALGKGWGGELFSDASRKGWCGFRFVWDALERAGSK